MASNFPSSLDSFTNPSSTDAMDSVSVPHATQHSDLNDAVEALQAKVGVDSSAVTTSLDYKVAQLESDVSGLVTGKILQVVRATDTTLRSTTSTSFVDANISVTITPTSATSDILLIWSLYASASSNRGNFQITDSSNVAIEGAEAVNAGDLGPYATYNAVTLVGYDSPATTSATTYKGRFSSPSGVTVYCMNASTTGQLFALEISA